LFGLIISLGLLRNATDIKEVMQISGLH